MFVFLVTSILCDVVSMLDLDLEEMVQLSTGTVADNATSVDMEQAYDIGEAKLMSFLKERVLVDEPNIRP